MTRRHEPDERTKRRIRWTVGVLAAVVLLVYIGTFVDQLVAQ